MYDKYYSNLGRALTAMEFDYSDGVRADIHRQGPRDVNIQEIGPTDDGVTAVSDTQVEYLPDQTDYITATVAPAMTAQAVNAILAPAVTANVTASSSPTDQNFLTTAVQLDDQGNPVINSEGNTMPTTQSMVDQLTAQAQAALPDAGGAVQSTASLVSSVSPALANTIQQKFAALTPGQKVAAGVGVYVGGKAALSFVPMKYLLIGGALYVYSQMQKQKAAAVATPAATTSATATPVAGMC